MLPEGGLKQYYQTNFALLYHHKLDTRIFDEMVPWERDIYINMMVKEIEEENLKNQLAAAQNRTANATKPSGRGKRR